MEEVLQRAISLLMAHADEDFVSKNDALLSGSNLHNLMIKFDQWNLIDDVLNEVNRAERKHPKWPDNVAYGILIVGEEYGEAMREAVKIQMNEADANKENLRMELVHTAATCLRMLKNLQS